MSNRYCERAGLDAAPRVEDVLGRDAANLFVLMVVALIERGSPMTIEEVAERLVEAGAVAPSGDMVLSLKKSWHGREPICRDPDGRLGLDLSSPELDQALWRAGLRPSRFHAPEPPLAEERSRQAEEASRLRLAVVRAVPVADVPRAVTLLDVRARSLRTLVGEDLASLPAVLGDLDVLIGLGMRETLHRMGLDPDRWRLVDLKPPRKSRRLNRSGRTLEITPELVISSTTGISRPLGEPERIAQYLAEGQAGKLARRLESDAKALFAFYQYGVLHRHVRLRWGFLDELYAVEWALPGEAQAGEILRSAMESGAPIDLVTGSAPGWAEPWSRARSGRVVDVQPWLVIVRSGDDVLRIDRRDIQAVRIAPGPQADRS